MGKKKKKNKNKNKNGKNKNNKNKNGKNKNSKKANGKNKNNKKANTKATKIPTILSTNIPGECAADGEKSLDCGSKKANYQSCCSGLVCHKVQTWRCVKGKSLFMNS